MTNNEYIESGILELYIAGSLSDAENEAVYHKLKDNPDLLDEVLKIEGAIMQLTAAASPKDSKHSFKAVKDKLDLNSNSETKVIPLQESKTNWFAYSGWAASVLLAGGLFWLLNQNSALESDIQVVETELQKQTIDNTLLEERITKTAANLTETQKLLSVIRDKDIVAIPLAGQVVSPESYAQVYWDKKENTVYLDVQGLPEPPEGKVYQVWSLTLNPLSPTSLGTIDGFTENSTKIFTIENANASEAFGITLEPAGGSTSPTMEQLYTLGAVTSAS
ncbi:anti-sigma factor [Bizionia argentinensis JUB59]|uniref:Anti-sigma factor n=1 Tax=Bizionia argentinensis JUB59 TaxID=1046627 RepID=G2EBF0_9FLAO|nr:anti-sigma factor [Bizionia argentinensis]EGV44426.1 anti-sigma factor [Bizionia argentinensis JUB59]